MSLKVVRCEMCQISTGDSREGDLSEQNKINKCKEIKKDRTFQENMHTLRLV